MSSEDPSQLCSVFMILKTKAVMPLFQFRLIKLHFLFRAKKRDTGNERGTKIDFGHAPILCHVAKCKQRASVG